MKKLFLAGCAVLLLATGTAHAIEYQGKLPKPVQKLPAYPPVVCVAPNWATESCKERREASDSYAIDWYGLGKFFGFLENFGKNVEAEIEKVCGKDVFCRQKDTLLVLIKEDDKALKLHFQKMDRDDCSDFLSGAHKAIVSQEQVSVKFVDRSVTGQVLASICIGPDGTWMGYTGSDGTWMGYEL